MKDLILWDGKCGFCRRSVEWLLARDQEGHLEAIPFQEASSPPMTPELYEACHRAVHVVKADGQILKAGGAMLYALTRVGYPVPLRLFRWPPFSWAIEFGYWVVARNRMFFSRILFPHVSTKR